MAEGIRGRIAEDINEALMRAQAGFQVDNDLNPVKVNKEVVNKAPDGGVQRVDQIVDAQEVSVEPRNAQGQVSPPVEGFLSWQDYCRWKDQARIYVPEPQFSSEQGISLSLTAVGRRLSVDQLTELAEKREAFESHLEHWRDHRKPEDKASDHAQIEHASFAVQAINEVLVASADKIVNSLERSLLKDVLTPGVRVVPIFLEPILMLPGIRQLANKFKVYTLKQITKDEIVKPWGSGRNLRHYSDINTGGKIAAGLLLAQDQRRKARVH